MPPADPFHHHPELRGMITPATESFFREMDLDEIDARARAMGRPDGWRTPCEEREAERRAWLGDHGNQELWVFGYGSLMWDPGIEFSEVRHASVQGYQRSFCLWDEGARGSLERPGLMLALDKGGTCEGLAFCIDAAVIEHETFVLFRREMIARAYEPHWPDLQTGPGRIKALGFVANHANERIKPHIPIAKQAEMISRAEGHLGTNFAYLAQTHERLEIHGIEDGYIADLHDRVARVRAGHGNPAPP